MRRRGVMSLGNNGGCHRLCALETWTTGADILTVNTFEVTTLKLPTLLVILPCMSKREAWEKKRIVGNIFVRLKKDRSVA